MKCPICVSVGQTSKFYWDSGGYGTSICGDSYYDEDGKYHNHNPNVEKRSCHCSRGHEFRVEVRHKCWCGHGEASTGRFKGEDGKWAEASPEQVEAVLGTNHGKREATLEVLCQVCNGTGSTDVGQKRRCRRCNGAGYIPTEIGEKVLALMRHNFKPMLQDAQDD